MMRMSGSFGLRGTGSSCSCSEWGGWAGSGWTGLGRNGSPAGAAVAVKLTLLVAQPACHNCCLLLILPCVSAGIGLGRLLASADHSRCRHATIELLRCFPSWHKRARGCRRSYPPGLLGLPFSTLLLALHRHFNGAGRIASLPLGCLETTPGGPPMHSPPSPVALQHLSATSPHVLLQTAR